jgi:hypothetical protein
MTQKMYFAHCMADYGNARERIALGLLAERFPGWEIVNPADYQEKFQRWRDHKASHARRPMQFWTDLVQQCDGLTFLFSGDDGDYCIGAGVAQEILTAHVWEMPTFQIAIFKSELDGIAATLAASTAFRDVLSIQETRDLIGREPQ